jgi:drug/metabolite transporter (DMT)-like permease
MAVQRAEMAGLQPWQYTKLIWAVAFDVLLFGLSPDPLAAIGIALILAGTALAATRRAAAIPAAGR